MLLWVTLLAGMLIVTTLLVVAMLRAERRARRSLYRALDLSEETIELLMSRNGDVLSELTLMRALAEAEAGKTMRARLTRLQVELDDLAKRTGGKGLGLRLPCPSKPGRAIVTP